MTGIMMTGIHEISGTLLTGDIYCSSNDIRLIEFATEQKTFPIAINKSEEFVKWLKGYVDIAGSGGIDYNELQIIKVKLDEAYNDSIKQAYPKYNGLDFNYLPTT